MRIDQVPLPPEGIDRLPKRYRDYILKIEELNRLIRSVRQTQVESHVWLEPYGSNESLPDGSTIRFVLGPERSIDVQLKEGHLNLMASGLGGRMIIVPNVSNDIWVTVIDQFPPRPAETRPKKTKKK